MVFNRPTIKWRQKLLGCREGRREGCVVGYTPTIYYLFKLSVSTAITPTSVISSVVAIWVVISIAFLLLKGDWRRLFREGMCTPATAVPLIQHGTIRYGWLYLDPLIQHGTKYKVALAQGRGRGGYYKVTNMRTAAIIRSYKTVAQNLYCHNCVQATGFASAIWLTMWYPRLLAVSSMPLLQFRQISPGNSASLWWM